MKRHLRRLVPSPAMVVALTALFLALGGSAYALVITGKSIRNNTVTGSDIRNGSLRGKDVHANGLGGKAIKESSLGTVPAAGLAYANARFAVVASNGVLVRGRSVTSVARTGAGEATSDPPAVERLAGTGSVGVRARRAVRTQATPSTGRDREQRP